MAKVRLAFIAIVVLALGASLVCQLAPRPSRTQDVPRRPRLASQIGRSSGGRQLLTWSQKIRLVAATPGMNRNGLVRLLGPPDYIIPWADSLGHRPPPQGTVHALEYTAFPPPNGDNVAYIYLSGQGAVLGCEFGRANINYWID